MVCFLNRSTQKADSVRRGFVEELCAVAFHSVRVEARMGWMR